MAVTVHKQTWSRNYLIPSLIALAILYSFLYNYILFGAVQESMDPDAQCSAAPGSDAHNSPHCSEVRLFRDWHEAEIIGDESDSSLLAEATLKPMKAVPEESKVESEAEGSAVRGSTRSAPAMSSTMAPGFHRETHADDILVAEVEASNAGAKTQRLRAKQRGSEFDRLEQQVRSDLKHDSARARTTHLIEDREEMRFEQEMESHESHHHEKSGEASENAVISQWQAQVDRLDSSIHEGLHAGDDTAWSKELASLKHRLQFQLNAHMRRYNGHEEKVFELRRAQLDKLEEALHAGSWSTAWDKLGSTAFELKQMRVRLDLEMGTHAMSTHALAQHNLTKDEANEDAHQEPGDRNEQRSKVTREIGERTATLENGLAEVASQDNLFGSSSAERPTSSSTGFLEKRLHWSSVNALSRSVVTGSDSEKQRVVTKGDVRHLQWAGVIPRVACITAISYSRHTKARMMYFIDNFKLQDYEGSRQLVLVYHYLDHDAEKLVQKYADGVFIKGVAARGADFPSSSALRYGVWSADADVVARWEFDGWHDPSRLSMQVRAMAAASRPACILQGKAHVKASTTEELSWMDVKEPSLVGERSWMKAYWQPYHREDREDEVPPPLAHVVMLNMDSVQVVGDSGQVQPTNLAPKEDSVNTTRETKVEAPAAHEWTMEECLNLENSSNVPQLTVDASTGIIENDLGHELSDVFRRLMAKRHDISQKLQLLCLETTMERDMKEHIFKRQHVEQMIGIRSELDKHIAATVALFSPGEQV